MSAEYAHALIETLRDTSSEREVHERVERIRALLEREGKTKALPGIARACRRALYALEARQPTLAVAREADAERARVELARVHPEATDTAEPNVRIDGALVGGWRYEDRTTLVDASYRTALLNLYRAITRDY